MAEPENHDLLFAVTAVQLNFASQADIAAATDDRLPGVSLRDALLSRGVLSAEDASAIDAVVRRRLTRSAGDAADAIEKSGAHDTLAEGGAPTPDALASGDPFHTVAFQSEPRTASQRYQVLRVHQQGGLGRVSVAKDVDFNREIALKEILPDRADDPDNRKRFVREAEITGALEHPGVVPVYSLGEHADGRPYYAMRFIHGVDLLEASDEFHKKTPTAERPLKFRRLLSSFVDVCQAIDYAHSRGVLHRDLKPSNIMLGDYGETLVVDWGLAKASGESGDSTTDLSAPPVSLSGRHAPDATHAGRVVGTPAYMSPEQAQGRIDKLGPATDIYGLGATLYHVITGVAPFHGDDVGVLREVRNGRFDKPSEVVGKVAKPLEAICLKAMAKQPSDRYATAGELALDIERYLADEPVSAYPEPWTVRAGRWARNHRGLVVSFLSTATLAIAMLSATVALLTAANQRERAAREAATQSAAEAQAERARAEQNFALARQAVQDYYVTVSEETLLTERGMHPLRDKLLRQALEYQQEFVAQRGDDETLLREVALAHYYTGQITETIDSPEASLAHYERAFEIQSSLAEAEGSDQGVLAEQARTANARGRALQSLRRFDEAGRAFETAATLRRRLAEANTDDAEAARELANSSMNLAVVKLQQGDADAALAEMRSAQALRRAHAPDPLRPDSRLARDIAKGDFNLALGYLTLGDADQALGSLTRAAEAFDGIAEASPRDGNNRALLANALRLLARLKKGAGDAEAATANYRRAAETLQALVDRNPDVVSYAGDLAGVRMDLAQHLSDTRELGLAEREIGLAVGLLRRHNTDQGLTPRLRRDLGVALRFWGVTLWYLDRHEDSRQRLLESQEVLRSLVRDNPGEQGYLEELSTTETELDTLTEEAAGEGP